MSRGSMVTGGPKMSGSSAVSVAEPSRMYAFSIWSKCQSKVAPYLHPSQQHTGIAAVSSGNVIGGAIEPMQSTGGAELTAGSTAR